MTAVVAYRQKFPRLHRAPLDTSVCSRSACKPKGLLLLLQVIWNSVTRGELLRFVDQQKANVGPDGKYTLADATELKYKALSEELQVSGSRHPIIILRASAISRQPKRDSSNDAGHVMYF